MVGKEERVFLGADVIGLLFLISHANGYGLWIVFPDSLIRVGQLNSQVVLIFFYFI